MTGIKIYTAGEMSGKIEEFAHPHDMVFCKNWRNKIQYLFDELKEVNIIWNHPVRIPGCHISIDPQDTVKSDIELIDNSDVIIAFLNRTELDGTIVELVHAVQKKKPIFLIITIDSNRWMELDEGTKEYWEIDLHEQHTMGGGGYIGNYWFLLHYLDQQLGFRFCFIESNLEWENGDIKDERIIQKKFNSFLESNGFILKNYKEYINSDEWKQKSKAFRTEAEGICSLCGDNVGVSKLKTHHKQYPKNFKQDNKKNWIAICDTCHKKIHGVI